MSAVKSRMQRFRWTWILAVFHGIVAAILLVWQQQNEQVITAMGMAWDTGAPLWPYETPWIIFAIINAPAVLAGRAGSSLVGLHAFREQLPVLLAATILLWFSIGASIDRGAFRRQIRPKPWLIGVLAGVALACLCVSVSAISAAVHWCWAFGAWSLSSALTFVRLVSIVPWCTFVVAMSVRTLFSSSSRPALGSRHSSNA
ncbi:hypothetical protein [Paludibaculum fermentans]|uniref:Transmembrane protein n=1 Tax=Paludibaculum fermentans TaxID=1473598 RepID=A0A7S7SMZ2_PALFE|nr:hypothetical protein [Paludibaculum fermentans]QOY89530.1 hypothetical protein IRI77_06140 [Paludibaculum fermentans]